MKSSAAQSPGALASDHGACPPPSPPRAPAGEGEDKSAKEGKRSDDDAKLSTLPRTGLTRSGRREQVGSVCARGRAGHFQGSEVSRETWARGGTPHAESPGDGDGTCSPREEPQTIPQMSVSLQGHSPDVTSRDNEMWSPPPKSSQSGGEQTKKVGA